MKEWERPFYISMIIGCCIIIMFVTITEIRENNKEDKCYNNLLNSIDADARYMEKNWETTEQMYGYLERRDLHIIEYVKCS